MSNNNLLAQSTEAIMEQKRIYDAEKQIEKDSMLRINKCMESIRLKEIKETKYKIHNISDLDNPMNIFNIFEKLSDTEIKFFKYLFKSTGRLDMNAYRPVIKKLNKEEQNLFYKTYEGLAEKNLVIRWQRGIYLINPNFIIPDNLPIMNKLWITARECLHTGNMNKPIFGRDEKFV